MIDSVLQFIIVQLQHFSVFGYWLAFFIALLETIVGIGVIIPGSTVLLFLGGFAAISGDLNFYYLVFFAALGAVLGDNFSYYLGRKFGKKWTKEGVWIIKPSHFELGRRFFMKHGGKSVLIGRFIPMVKEIMPFVSGMVKMDYLQFFLFNILGVIGWSFEFLGFGFIFAGSVLLAQIWLERVAFLVFFILVFIFLLAFIKWVLVKYGRLFFRAINDVLNLMKDYLISKPLVQRWLANNSKIILFFKNRISTKTFFGLPLTVFVFLFFYFLLVFTGLVGDFMAGDVIVQIDARLVNLLYLFRYDSLISFFLWVSLLANTQVVIVFMSISVIYLFINKKINKILPLLISVFSANMFVFMTKLFIHRVRPDLVAYVDSSYSFPSSYATIAVAFYGFLAWLLIRWTKRWKTRVNIMIYTVFILFFVGFSRLYLGVDYLSDVLCGFALGATILVFSVAVSEYLETRFSNIKVQRKSYSSKIIIIILCLVGVVFYIVFGLNYHKTLDFKQSDFSEIQKINDISELFYNKGLKFTETITGRETEPVNFIFIADDLIDVEKIFTDAQWYTSDSLTLRTVAKMLDNLLGGNLYKTAPITPLFWNKNVQNLAFQKLVNDVDFKIRHHIRIWKTPFSIDSKKIFVGSAVFDDGIKWGITHRISADIDTERETVFMDLQGTGEIENYKKIDLVPSYDGYNFSGDEFVTDGGAYVLKLE